MIPRFLAAIAFLSFQHGLTAQHAERHWRPGFEVAIGGGMAGTAARDVVGLGFEYARTFRTELHWTDGQVTWGVAYGATRVSMSRSGSIERPPATYHLHFVRLVGMAALHRAPTAAVYAGAEAGYVRQAAVYLPPIAQPYSAPGATLAVIGGVRAMRWRALGLDARVGAEWFQLDNVRVGNLVLAQSGHRAWSMFAALLLVLHP